LIINDYKNKKQTKLEEIKNNIEPSDNKDFSVIYASESSHEYLV